MLLNAQPCAQKRYSPYLPPAMSVALELATDAKHPVEVLKGEDVGLEQSRFQDAQVTQR